MAQSTSPDDQLDTTHPYQQPPTWNNTADRVAWQRAFDQGTAADVMMAQALQMADPMTPEDYIRDTLSVETVPPRIGYDRTQPGIDTAFGLPTGSPDAMTDPEGRTSDKSSSLRNHYEVL